MTTRSDETNSADLVARSAHPLRGSWRRAPLLVLFVHGGACATVTYPGPRLPSDRVATIESRNIIIDKIDGLDVRGKGPTFEIRPGHHALIVHFESVKAYPIAPHPTMRLISVAKTDYSLPMPFCVSAQPRHHYLLEPKGTGTYWEPVILDGASDVRVPPCGPVVADHRGDFPCDGPLTEESLASGVQKVIGCGIENVYGYDLEAGEWKSVAKQAIFELNCPLEQLTVRHLGGTAVSVTGCGLRADYLAETPCVSGLCAFRGWVPNTAAPR